MDANPEKYSIEFLLRLKQEHEQWVKEQLDIGLSHVTFAELEIAAKALSSGDYSELDDFSVIPIEQKISKNNLSPKSRYFIAMGISRSSEVEKFLASMAQIIDSEFPERLKNGFKKKYSELCKSCSGDELFMSMLHFVTSGQKDFTQQAAGLAILAHMFHICEIFEK